MKSKDGNVWSIVLAAGDGKRLRELTTMPSGETVPKQFCSLNRRECLLQLALQRAAGISPSEKVGAIVAAQHRRWWRNAMQGMPSSNLIVQPSNRGTAIGTALALLHLERRDPDAVVVLLPADHYVEQEATLSRSLRELADLASSDPGSVFLLGAQPDAADTELGYIVPARTDGDRGLLPVREFVEKPRSAEAVALLADGALWNMFIIAGSLPTLLGLFEKSYNFLQPMREAMREPVGSLGRLYRSLPVVDFSRDVLAHYPQRLKVLEVPTCGWTDLGTPDRVAQVAKARPQLSANSKSALYLDLVRAVGDR